MEKKPRRYNRVTITDDNDDNSDDSPVIRAMNALPRLHSFTVEDDIPLPDRVGTLGIPWRAWPFERMQVGQSFLVPYTSDQKDRKRTAAKVTYAIGHYRTKHPEQQFTCRSMDDGVRCWRVQ